jgi:hypothetical protein
MAIDIKYLLFIVINIFQYLKSMRTMTLVMIMMIMLLNYLPTKTLTNHLVPLAFPLATLIR